MRRARPLWVANVGLADGLSRDGESSDSGLRPYGEGCMYVRLID